MKMTPLDVGGRRFPRKFRGYDPREVEIFLEMVGQEMEDLIQENRYVTEDLKRKIAELSDFKENERLLKGAMITAQKMAEDMKTKMLKEAQVIVAQAELEGETIVRRAQERAIELMDEIRSLQDDRVRAREELRALINTYQALLEAGEKKSRTEDEDSGTLCVMPKRRAATGGE